MSGFSQTPMGRVIAKSAVAVSLTGSTNETTLATITLPGGAMGANGQVEMEALFTITGSANAKTLRMKFGGTTYVQSAITTASTVAVPLRTRIANRNAANSQVGAAIPAAFGGASNANVTSAVNTDSDAAILITGQLALGTETITLESYRVILYP